jgi:hypothetical protein
MGKKKIANDTVRAFWSKKYELTEKHNATNGSVILGKK